MVQLPMKSTLKDKLPVESEPYVVSYNGEIYEENAKNLQTEIAIVMKSVEKKYPHQWDVCIGRL